MQADSEIMLVDLAFWGDFFASMKISHGTTLERPFQAFRLPTKILQGPGCRFYGWFVELIAISVLVDKKSIEKHKS